MEIRQATPADAGAIAEVEVRSRRTGYASFMPIDFLEGLTIEDATDLWQSRFLDPNFETLIAESEGRIAGFVRYGEADAPDVGTGTGEVKLIFVHPDFWRHGVGSGLLADAERGLIRFGFWYAVLSVYEGNEQARRFYERNGWGFDGTSWQVERGGKQLTELRYAKYLSPR
jgi:GNAT superfamily N-acetyltransferase